MNKLILLVSLTLLFLPLQTVWGQESPRVIAFANPLTNGNQIWSITQTPDFRMCFATSKGLIICDGVHWTQPAAGSNDIIRSVTNDQEGTIFSGSFNEFGYWKQDESPDLGYHSLITRAKKELPAREEIWNIVYRDSTVYFQSFSTIFKYDYSNIELLKPPGNIMFLHLVHNKLLFQVIDNGLYELTSENSFRFLQGTSFLSDKKVVFILPHDDASFLIGTEQNGVFLFNDNDGTVRPWSQDRPDLFKTYQLNKGIELSNGDFAFGTILNGLYLLDRNGKVTHHLSRLDGLMNNTVLSLYEDKMGNLWAGLDRGMNLIELNTPLSFYNDQDGTLGTVYSAILFAGDLYLGTNHGVFYRTWNKRNQTGQNALFQLIEGTQGQVWELKNYNGQLWCGHNDGTFLIENYRARKISSINGGWVSTVLPEQKDMILQGTYSGLVIFKRDKKGKWIFSHRVSGFNEPVKNLIMDSTGYLWVANPIEGLFRLKLDSSFQQINYLHRLTNADNLPSEKFIELVSLNNEVLIKSDEVWFTYNKASRLLSALDSYNGIPAHPGNFRIIRGRNDDWFQAYNDKVEYHSSGHSSAFSVSLVPGSENIVLIDSSRYLFCLDDGYALFDHNQLFKNPNNIIPPPTVCNIEVTGTNPASFTADRPREFSWKENHLIFHFTQPVFNQQPVFQYWLEGLDPDWLQWTTIGFKEYNNIPAGNYTFHLRSSLSTGQDSFHFTVQPHWSKSNAALLFYLLTLVGLGWLFIWLHKKRLARERLEMEMEKERQLHEQRIATANEHLQQDIINKSKELANSTMNLVQKNEILLQIKADLAQLKQHLPGRKYQHLMHVIETHLTANKDWELFESNFNNVHEQFFKNLKAMFPDLTPGDLQLAAYLKMNLSSKEIAPLLHISIRGVENKRYRLRKKLGLPSDGNLIEFMMQY